MKKIALSVAFMMLLQLAFAGGILTNYNQSAQYVRMLSRNASLDVDAVFYNPAGLVKLEDGWHFSFSSQTLWQTREIYSGFPLLNDGNYEGKTFAPVFPDVYAVYKKEKLALSFGLGPVAGGGSANFDNGLPSFEIPFSKLGLGLKTISPLLSSYGIPGAVDNGYGLDMSFDASSIFWGIQVGASYAFNDMISIYGGVRLLPSSNSYKGNISNIIVPTTAGDMSAEAYLSAAKPILDGTINSLDQASTGLQTAIDAGYIDGNAAVTDPTLIQLLAAFGITDATNQEAVGYMNATQSKLTTIRDADVSDKYVDVKQKGMGFTPIIAVNISPNDDWNIGLKYEQKTKLTLVNETTADDMGMFPDGAKIKNDIPGIFTAGVGYRGLDWLEVQLSYNLYLDKGVDWGNNVRYAAVGETVHREIDNNSYELGAGFQFNLSEKFAVSVGGLYSSSGVAESYQSDFSYSNSSKTIAGGIMWKITDHLTFDAGVLNTFYDADEVNFTDPDVGAYQDTYNKTTFGIAAGLTYSIF